MDIHLKVDSNLPRLAAGLGELREDVQERILHSSISDAGKQATTTAKKAVIKRGGYDRVGLAGRVRSNTRFRMIGHQIGRISATNPATSLARRGWADNVNPKGNYTRSGLRGVRIRNHVTDRDWFRIGGRKAFIRAGASGNVHVFTRTSDARHPIVALHAINPSHVMHHKVVFQEIKDKFETKVQERFFSKYTHAVAKVKARHGL